MTPARGSVVKKDLVLLLMDNILSGSVLFKKMSVKDEVNFSLSIDAIESFKHESLFRCSKPNTKSEIQNFPSASDRNWSSFTAWFPYDCLRSLPSLDFSFTVTAKQVFPGIVFSF